MNITPEMLALGMIWYVVFLFSLTCHEGAHALAANWGGDLTAFHGGQVTLNPLPHIQREPFGTILAPIITYALMGWMMGWASAPYDPDWQRRYPRRAAWMALAGPAANLLLLLVAALGIRAGMALGYFRPPQTISFTRLTEATNPETFGFLATFLSILFLLNLVLGLFNLLPVPPLDGHTGITLLMSERSALRFLDWFRDPSFSFMGILVAWLVFGRLFGYVFPLALRALYPEVSYG